MLRIHCMQHWYNLSDGAMEDALYEIASMRLFARLSLDSALPDRTTIMNFRHLLEQHQLARQLFKTINRWLAEAGVMMTQGTLVDATIIEAPSSTKNKEQQRDPQMHQTKKGNQWHFGMKAHIGVDAKSGLTHSLVTTAANEHDLNQLGNLLHGEEQFVSADAGYQGAPQREELAEVDVDWLIAERPGKVRTLKQHPRKNKTAINIEYMKASIRAKVEHPFRIIKRQFGFVKARYKGLLRIPVKLNSDSGICEHHFRKVCGQGFFEQKLSFEGRHLFDSLNKPAAKRSAAVVDPRRWNRTVHLTSEYVH